LEVPVAALGGQNLKCVIERYNFNITNKSMALPDRQQSREFIDLSRATTAEQLFLDVRDAEEIYDRSFAMGGLWEEVLRFMTVEKALLFAHEALPRYPLSNQEAFIHVITRITARQKLYLAMHGLAYPRGGAVE
jgi:hypothetical protein